ncbi:MAG: RtcB family protein [Ferruginibacter sp.]
MKRQNMKFLDRDEFRDIFFLQNLQHKALKQLGSSGSGNHFVEFGKVEITDADNPMQFASWKLCWFIEP